MNETSKILLVGPYPPPHGGISVHVRNAQAMLTEAGVRCRVLNSDECGRRPLKFIGELFRDAVDGWALHVHTNGHNQKSWIIALTGGIAAQFGAGGVLTLHSGLAPDFVARGPFWRRGLTRLSCLLYRRVVCVNREIADALAMLGIPRGNLKVMPAYLQTQPSSHLCPPYIDDWLAKRQPVVSAVLSFRPEYGFELLANAIRRLRHEHPRIGCVVMGGGEERPSGEELVRHLGIGDAMLLTGDLDHDLCLQVMARSELFVRATHWDGDAISVREALSLGLPVVASNVGERPEGTLLFKAGDLDGLVQGIERGLQMPKAVRNGLDDDAIQRLLDLYKSLA
jgi:glycosyltransferase involved in cell wall biosynthesis